MYGRRLTDEERMRMDAAIHKFLSSVSQHEVFEPKPIPAITRKSFKPPNDNTMLKYVSEETLNFLMNGSIRLGTATHYRNCENLKIKDHQEGISRFHIGCGPDEIGASILSGFNCLVLCGTSSKNSNHEYMTERFGTRVIRIHNVNAFSTALMKLIGAKAYYFYDVLYSDLKSYCLESKKFQKIKAFQKGADLTEAKLRELNKYYFQIFYDAAFIPSMFMKPTQYLPECERRIVFELPHDINKEYVTVTDRKLTDYFEIVR
jgi:hypothetical protein